MMRWQVEPMERWPYPEPKQRQPTPFRASFNDTLQLLSDELDMLFVYDVVAVRVVADRADVRRDGMLRQHANVRHPGVAVSFVSKDIGAMTVPCAAFEARWSHQGAHWQANLRAITLGLKALRQLDRYGIATRKEQYRGWAAIEAGPSTGFASADDAWRWLAGFAGRPVTDDYGPTLRTARAKAHPDRGGDPADWRRVDEAAQLLAKAGRS